MNFCFWRNVFSFQWRLKQNATPSSNTGPNADHTSGDTKKTQSLGKNLWWPLTVISNNVFALLEEKHNQSRLIFMINVKENSYLWDAPSLESVTLVKSYYFLLKEGNVCRNRLKTLKQTPSPRKCFLSYVHSFAFDTSFILIGFTLSATLQWQRLTFLNDQFDRSSN